MFIYLYLVRETKLKLVAEVINNKNVPLCATGKRYDEKVDVFSFGIVLCEVGSRTVEVASVSFMSIFISVSNYRQLIFQICQNHLSNFYPTSTF